MAAYRHEVTGGAVDQRRDWGFESDRLAALMQTGLLDTDPEPDWITVEWLLLRRCCNCINLCRIENRIIELLCPYPFSY